MPTNTSTPFRTVVREWDKLEPAILSPEPDTIHKRLPASSTFAKGQLIGATATPGVWDVPANALANSRLLPLVYPWATDASGYANLGSVSKATDVKNESVEVYHQGAFFVKDLVGLTEANVGRVGRLVQGTMSSDGSNVFSDDAIIELT